MLLNSLLMGLRSQTVMQAEIIALRHQLTVLQRNQPKLLLLNRGDRCLWVWLSRLWSGWRYSLIIVKPETAIGWHRQGFRWYWTWKIRRGRSGRPRVPKETRDLIRPMSRENPTWGAPRIHSELMRLDIRISESSVAKYMFRTPKPSSQTRRTFLNNHVSQLASVDFFTVYTVWLKVSGLLPSASRSARTGVDLAFVPMLVGFAVDEPPHVEMGRRVGLPRIARVRTRAD
jgi:putative transposase